jgi:hypothetical protein
MLYNFKYLTIDRFGQSLENDFRDAYGRRGEEYAGYVNWIGRFALENIANSDMLYHDVEHTMLVTTVGQQILLGKHLLEGGVTTRDWAHFITALLCHDIGYVRGICRLDRNGTCATGIGEETISLPPGSTDAMMQPYHVDRGKQFVLERFGQEENLDIDADLVARYIEMTRFPVPDDEEHRATDTYGGLLRAADLIGQLGDPDYLRKIPALFFEFEQIGSNDVLGFKNPDDMRRGYATFFWNDINPYIQDAARYLRATQDGKQWLANLHSHVFQVEHGQD